MTIRSWTMLLGAVMYGSTGFTQPVRPQEAGVRTVLCKDDVSLSYALYVPAKHRAGPMPVIYFFDPHGDGKLPLRRYSSLADEFGYILAGSNNSKNGNDWPATARIWRYLSEDTRSRLPIDKKRIYLAGFSGGAKVAGYLALQDPGIRGVIANGAGLPDGTPAGNFTFSFTAIAGEGDMNMTDLVESSGDLDRTRTRHRMLLFDGIHEWAPVATMRAAFAGLGLDAMRDGAAPKDAAAIARWTTGSKKRLDAYRSDGRLLKVMEESVFSVSLLEGIDDAAAGWFRKEAAALANNADYRRQRQERDRLLVAEEQTKAEYMQHFQGADMNYWNKIIAELRQGKQPPGERQMAQRLLAYLSLAFYSISNHLISSNDNGSARRFVTLYERTDPGNSEAWYFSAVLDMREGSPQSAEKDLFKAVQCGFTDKERLARQAEFARAMPGFDPWKIRQAMDTPPTAARPRPVR